MTQQISRINPNLWVQLLIVVLSRGATYMVMPFVSILMGRQFGLAPTKIGLIIGVSAFLGSLAGFYGGYISDRFGRKAVMHAALSLYASAFLTLAYARSIWLFVPVFLLVGMARSLFEPASEAFVSDLSVGAKQKEFMFTMRFLCINIAAAHKTRSTFGRRFTNYRSRLGNFEIRYYCAFLVRQWPLLESH